MANRIAKDKKQISLTLTTSQLKRVDARAVELGTSRAALISKAVDAYLDGDAGADMASAKLETIIAKLDGLKSDQAALKAEQQAQAALLAAKIDAQPIAVQQLAAPQPPEERQPERKGLLDRMLGR